MRPSDQTLLIPNPEDAPAETARRVPTLVVAYDDPAPRDGIRPLAVEMPVNLV